MTRILLVDDDPQQLRHLAEITERLGYRAETAGSGQGALNLLRSNGGFAAVVLDLAMPDLDGMGVLAALLKEGIAVPVIVHCSGNSLDAALNATRLGAADFVVKPVPPERLAVALRNALRIAALERFARFEQHRRSGTLNLGDIVGVSPVAERVAGLVRRAGRSPMPVLIEGERGTGKALVARVLHGSGDRAGRPFVAVDCAGLAETLCESTLFGHRAGALPGAIADNPGRCLEAQGGTLFLENIGDLSPGAQAALLRLVAEGRVTPVGGTPAPANIRVIASTDVRLLNLTKSGLFREDLFYRLNVFPIYLPPLRERREDIPALAAHFLGRIAAETGQRPAPVSAAVLQLLGGHDWPGNVAELEAAMHHALVLAAGDPLEPAHFPQLLIRQSGTGALRAAIESRPLPLPVSVDAAPNRGRPAIVPPAPDRFLSPAGDLAPLASLERDLIAFALERYEGHMSQAARSLGIGRSTLYRKLKSYGLNVPGESDAA